MFCYSLVLKCPALMTDSTHLIVSTRNRTFGTRVVFSCPTGFELAGPPYLNCLAGGNWSDATPTCRRMYHLDLYLYQFLNITTDMHKTFFSYPKFH